MSAPKKPNKKGDAPKGGAPKAPGKPAGAGKDGGKAPAKAEAPKPVAAAAPAAPKVEEKAAPVAEAPAPAAAAAAASDAAPAKHRAFRRKLVGRVTSDKMAKTVVVEVARSTLNPMYKKYVRSREHYKAHDETNQYKVGDRVEIQEHRPISREKRWIVTRLISRPVEE